RGTVGSARSARGWHCRLPGGPRGHPASGERARSRRSPPPGRRGSRWPDAGRDSSSLLAVGPDSEVDGTADVLGAFDVLTDGVHGRDVAEWEERHLVPEPSMEVVADLGDLGGARGLKPPIEEIIPRLADEEPRGRVLRVVPGRRDEVVLVPDVEAIEHRVVPLLPALLH